MNKTVSISIPEELFQEVKKSTERTGATFSGTVRLALDSYIKGGDRNEDN